MKKVDIVSFRESRNQQYAKDVLASWNGARHFYYIETYGCQMNVHDSEKLAGMLSDMGYEKADSKEEADIILFNTCCVRENAELRVYGNLGALRALKEQKPSLVIGVCGCMMQQEKIVSGIKRRFPFVDIVFGSHNTFELPRLLASVISMKTPVYEIQQEATEIVEDFPVRRDRAWSAWITVMYGCNNFCSYCIVPYVRGRERSRKSEDIIKEARELAAGGCREITLLGQNVNSYGKDCGEISFAQLLRRLNEIEGIERICFMTSHPKDCSDELIQAIAECEHVAKQLHLPVQSGSDRILRMMNRRYTREDYLALIRRVRSAVPDIGLTTDIIVGFPGETEEDFQETMRLYEEVGFASAYMFIYSKRSGTPAAESADQIPLAVKKERLSRLIALQAEYTNRVNLEHVGKTYEVLAESVSKRSSKMISGRTSCGRMVSFQGDPSMIGSFVRVYIKEAKANTLLGELV